MNLLHGEGTMRIQYQLTFDDYRAAQRLNTRTPKNAPPSWWEKWQFMVYALALPAVWLGYGMVEQAVWPTALGQRAGSEIIATVMVSLFPWLIVQAIIWLMLCKTLSPRDRRISRNVHIAFLLLMAGTFALSAYLVPETPVQPSAQPWTDFLLGLVPTGLFMLAYLITMTWYLRGLGRRNWEMSQHLQYPTTLDVGDDEMRILTSEYDSRYKWNAFRRFVEDDRVFSIYVSDAAFLIVPKHGFADPLMIERFRTMLEIRLGTPARSAFEPRPVLSHAAPPPLPGTPASRSVD